ncbi:hypothetical protein HZS_6754 [Henneguya salminicola]|nr:hypothetical protein HZS_6754 [Henneguya salminicola]
MRILIWVKFKSRKTKIHKNEKYGFDQFDRFCLYPDPHLIKYEKLLKTIVERNDDLNRDNKYDTKIPKYNEIIKAHNNWYRIKRTKKHYMILKLMPLVASYEDPQNQLEFENVSVNLSQEYTDIQTTNSELQEKIYEVLDTV